MALTHAPDGRLINTEKGSWVALYFKEVNEFPAGWGWTRRQKTRNGVVSTNEGKLEHCYRCYQINFFVFSWRSFSCSSLFRPPVRWWLLRVFSLTICCFINKLDLILLYLPSIMGIIKFDANRIKKCTHPGKVSALVKRTFMPRKIKGSTYGCVRVEAKVRNGKVR